MFCLCAYAWIVPLTSSLPNESSLSAAIATPLPKCDPSTRTLAEFLGYEASEGAAVDIEAVISICEEAEVCQIYGPVYNRDELNPIITHLLCIKWCASGGNATCDGTHDEDAMLSAKDIVSRVKFREGDHVNLIACDSGVSYTNQGDDTGDAMCGILLSANDNLDIPDT